MTQLTLLKRIYIAKQNFFGSLISFLIVVICGATAFVGNAKATTYVVTNTANDGAGSLRQAVNDANSTSAADAINFNISPADPNCAADAVCTITLTGGLITIQPAGGALSIVNSTGAAKLIISGNNANRIFEVSQSASLILDGVTVTRGASNSNLGVVSNTLGTLIINNCIFTQNTGGFVIYARAFMTDGTLSVSNTTINANIGTGIFFTNNVTTGGVLNVTNSIISNNAAAGSGGGNGGGIYFSGNTATIANSTVSGNSNSRGGGIFIAGIAGTVADITNCTIRGNTATVGGGGIEGFNARINITKSTISNNVAGDFGGGVYVTASSGGLIDISNSTISGNSSNFRAGGIFAGRYTVRLINSTITGNTATEAGGGIESTVQATIAPRNTIVADNLSPIGPDFYLSGTGVASSRGNNLIGNSINVGSPSNAFWNASDILNQMPRLAPLADNGGATQTHALLPNSPAINAGNNCVLTFNGCGDNNPALPTDQRGRARVGTVDIGAFEFAARTVFDFDGDGKADISVFRPSNGVWYLQQSQNGFTGTAFGQNGDLIAPADFDGDGKTDINVFRPSNGIWYRLNSSDGQFIANPFGQNGDLPVPADYDGDGKANLAVFRPAAGFWYIARPTGNPAQNFDSVAFGANGDVPAPADYDGDGKTDIAVFRPSNGVWYRLGSTAGYSGVLFGQQGDVPVAADYDGDGKADIAVFRNGVWYLLQSTNGFAGQIFGLATDKPIPSLFIP